MDAQYTQAQMDTRDLQIGRLFVALNDALAQNKQLADLCRKHGQEVAGLEGTIRERDEKIAELRELVATLTDDEDDDEGCDRCDEDDDEGLYAGRCSHRDDPAD